MGKYLVGMAGVLGGVLVGGWLMLAPFALAYQVSGAEWVGPTYVDFWSGLAILVVSLIGLIAYSLGLIAELRRRGIIERGETAQAAEQIQTTGALAGSGAAPAVGTPVDATQTNSDDVEQILVTAMLEDMQDQQPNERQIQPQDYQRQEEQQQEERTQEEQLQEERQQEEQLQEEQLQEEQLQEEQLGAVWFQEERQQYIKRQEDYRQEDQAREEQLQEEQAREDQRQEEQLREERLQEERLREEQLREEQLREEQLREERRQEERRREDDGAGWSATPRWRLDRGRR